MPEDPRKNEKSLFLVVIAIALIGFGGGGFLYYNVAKNIMENTTDLEIKVLELGEENVNLIDALQKEKQKNGNFESQIGQIVGTVDSLNKLAKIDKELLQKYSKVYFLNENYMPKGLIDVSQDYIFDKNKTIKILASTSPFLLQMIDDAKRDGVDLLLISGYRSFSEQSALKDNYKMTYGSGANKFSADQGYSEHQLGTAIDFTSRDLGIGFSNFAKSKEYGWLLANAYKYGFILSYPSNNAYYQYEPWHWRFVGKELAKRLHEEKQNFYELVQRQIDPYLGSIFDQN